MKDKETLTTLNELIIIIRGDYCLYNEDKRNHYEICINNLMYKYIHRIEHSRNDKLWMLMVIQYLIDKHGKEYTLNESVHYNALMETRSRNWEVIQEKRGNNNENKRKGKQ